MPVVCPIPTPLPAIGLDSPGSRAIAVTKSDSDELPFMARSLRVGTTAGDITVVTVGGDTVTIPNVLVGETIFGMFKQVRSTGTTAVGITAFG